MFQKKKYIWLLLTFVILSIKSFSFLKIDVDPRGIDMDISKQITKEVTVINQTNQFVRYKVSLEKPKNLKDEYYLGDKIIIYPRVISLKPKGIQVIRLRLKKPIKTKGIDYTTKICFDELVSGKIDDKNSKISEEKVSIATNFTVRIEMYVIGSSEKSNPVVTFKNSEIQEETFEGKKTKYLVFKVKNQGKKFFKPRMNIKVLKGKKQERHRQDKFFNMMAQEEERDLKIDLTKFSKGDKLEVQIYDYREPKKILLQEKIKI